MSSLNGRPPLGWAPSTFVSSRQKKAPVPAVNVDEDDDGEVKAPTREQLSRPEYYMDEAWVSPHSVIAQ